MDLESGVPRRPRMKSCYMSNGSSVPELEYLGTFLKNSKKHKDLFDHPVISAMIWAKWQRIPKYIFFHP